MADTIREASTVEDFAAFAGLVSEYVEWCRVRYAEHPWFVDRVFGHQTLASELVTLRSVYSPPNGKACLASGTALCAVPGPIDAMPDGACEMKRLFVPDRCKGHVFGRRLCETLIDAACADGYMVMRLDTGHLFTEAIALYTALGFRACPPYHAYPPEIMPFLVFMERPLA